MRSATAAPPAPSAGTIVCTSRATIASTWRSSPAAGAAISAPTHILTVNRIMSFRRVIYRADTRGIRVRRFCGLWPPKQLFVERTRLRTKHATSSNNGVPHGEADALSRRPVAFLDHALDARGGGRALRHPSAQP